MNIPILLPFVLSDGKVLNKDYFPDAVGFEIDFHVTANDPSGLGKVIKLDADGNLIGTPGIDNVVVSGHNYRLIVFKIVQFNPKVKQYFKIAQDNWCGVIGDSFPAPISMAQLKSGCCDPVSATQRPILDIIISTDKPKYCKCDRIRLNVKVKNSSSTTDATDVILTDILGAGFEYDVAFSSSGIYDPATGKVNFGTIPAGMEAELQLVGYVNAEGMLSNSASVVCNEGVVKSSMFKFNSGGCGCSSGCGCSGSASGSGSSNDCTAAEEYNVELTSNNTTTITYTVKCNGTLVSNPDIEIWEGTTLITSGVLIQVPTPGTINIICSNLSTSPTNVRVVVSA